MLFSVKKIFWGLIAIVVLLMAIHTFNTLSINFLANDLPSSFIEKFHIDQEANVPTWFSASLSFATAFAAFLVFKFERQLPAFSQQRRTFWFIFMCMFLFLSLDEAAMVHEFTGNLFGVKWVYLYAPPIVILLAYCLYTIWGKKIVESDVAYWITTGMVIAVIGGLVMEWVWFQFPLPYAWNQVRLVLEEGGEVLGAIFILRGVLLEANNHYQQVGNFIKKT